MRIVLLGPPGSGKGTQAKLLSQKLKFSHISTGEILREEVKELSVLGLEAKGYMDKGELVPDALVTRIIKEKFAKSDIKDFILDGYPRNIAQAETLDNILGQQMKPIDMVLYLDTSEGEIIKRLSGRRVCQSCNRIYHILTMSPKKDMICDSCGTALFQRDDDKVETIKNRLNVYFSQTSPLIEYYKKQSKLVKVSADKDPATINGRLLSILTKDGHLKV